MKMKLQIMAIMLLLATSLQAQWLFWGNGQYQNFQGNPWAGVQLDLALRFEPSDLTNYAGKSITKMKFHPGPVANSANYILKIWEANQGGTPVLKYSQAVSSITFGQWNEVELTSSWLIDVSKELWFGVSVSHTGSVGFDAGPPEPGKGNKFGDGNQWFDWGDGNWTVQAYAEEAAPTLYTLSLLTDPLVGGVVTGAGSYQAGAVVSIQATENQGYQFVKWIYDGSPIFTSSFDFTMPANDVSMTAVFEPISSPSAWLFWGTGEYQNFQSNPWSGVQLDLALRFEPSDLSGFHGNSITKMRFHPGPVVNTAGYQLKIWEANSGANPVLKYSQPVASIFFGEWNEVELTTPWTIDISKELWFGVSVGHTGNVGFDAGPPEPGKGNKFGNGFTWFDWGDGNWLVQAFVQAAGQSGYTLTLMADPENGGSVNGAGTYEAGENVNVQAYANPGFDFVNWSKGAEVISTQAEFTYTMPAENVTLTANFVSNIPQYTLTLAAIPETGGVVNGAGSYHEGDQINISAIENPGYAFVKWTMNGQIISSQPAFVFTMPAADASLVAHFDIIYPLAYEANIGQGQQFPQQVRMPYDFDWRNSISQTLYYPDELGISRGIINQLTYFKNFQNNIMGRAVKVWMGETTLQNLSGGWIPPSELTLVFDGVVDFPQGVGEVSITLQNNYEYNGGVLVIYSNRVFEQQYFSWNDRFYATEDIENKRTRQFNEDVPIDPLNPPLTSNYLLNWHPNTRISFPTSFLGGIQGTVTDGVLPLEGVKVTIEGTTAQVFTNNNGYYHIPFIMADIYDINFSKVGYNNFVASQYQIEPGSISTLNVVLNESLQVQVYGVVQGNDGVLIENASLLLSGNSNYATTSGYDGQFLFEDVFEGPYTLIITADGYLDYLIQNLVVSGTNPDLGIITLTERILPPVGLHVEALNQGPGNALLQWYHGEEKEFRYDNGTYTYWVGSAYGNINSIFGSAFRSDAVVTEISWYLTSEYGIIYPNVKLWVFGLDRNGNPDTELLLYSQANVPNIMDEWSVHILPQPIVASNGFLIGISYDSFFALGCDDGLDPDWPFTANTMYYADYGDTNFAPFESFLPTWSFNFMLRAKGIENEITGLSAQDTKTNNQGNERKLIYGQAQKSHTPDYPFSKGTSESKHRAFNGFNIYLNNMTSAWALTSETHYMFTYLPDGLYEAGVQSVYGSGLSDIVTVQFEVVNGAPPQIIHLPEGWSGWSSYIMPDGLVSFAEVVAPITDQMIIAQHFTQLFYPAYGLNTMGNFTNTHGFVTKMSNVTDLTLSGLRAPMIIELNQGWNLLPVMSHCAIDADEFFGQIPELIIAYEVAGNGIYWPGFTTTLESLAPGKAYWVKVSDACTVSFQACDDELKTAYIPPIRYSGLPVWNEISYTNATHVAVFQNNALDHLVQGDIIGAFTTEGKCAGITIFDGTNGSLVLFGDDITTMEKDGFDENEKISFRLYRPSTQEEFFIEVVYCNSAPSNNGLFTCMGMSVINDFGMALTTIDSPGNDLLKIHPNPSGGLFHIISEKAGNYFIKDISGQIIKAGHFAETGTIDLTEHPNGIYFLFTDQLTTPGKLIKR